MHNYLTGFIIDSLAYYYGEEREFEIVIDKFIRRERREDFDSYVRYRFRNNYFHPIPPRLTIRHLDSQSTAGLQIADFIAGAVFQHFERKNSEYCMIIKPKLVRCIKKWF